MKPDCEYFEEYNFSKYLLFRYVSSSSVVAKVSTMMHDILNQFVKEHIYILLKRIIYSATGNTYAITPSTVTRYWMVVLKESNITHAQLVHK